MRFTLIAALLALSTGVRPCAAGTDPTNSAQLFQLESVTLNPGTFLITLVIGTPRVDLFYGVQVHDGPPASNATWSVALPAHPGTGATLTFLDDVSGSLSYSGKTYRGFVSLAADSPTNFWVITANQEFVAYPFLSLPEVAVNMAGSSSNLVVTYGEGIYTNQVQYTVPPAEAGGYFRMLSTNNDPANAFIQVMTNLADSAWSDVGIP